MQKGNLLLIHYSFDPIGKLIRLFTHSYWNHIALFISDKELIESSRQGIKTISSSKYDNRILYKTKIIKTNLTYYQKKKIIYHALSLRRTLKYLYRLFIFTLLSLNRFYNAPPITCSGFIACCFSKVGIIFNKDKLLSHITPEDIRKYYE